MKQIEQLNHCEAKGLLLSAFRFPLSASMRVKPRSGFTLMEMLVVIAMLGILMGSVFTGVAQARRQAQIAKANTEMRELVNAWLAFGQAYDEDVLGTTGGDVDATREELGDLLGDEGDMVFLNVPIVNGAFRDPWGNPYRFRIEGGGATVDDADIKFSTTVTFPNRGRGR